MSNGKKYAAGRVEAESQTIGVTSLAGNTVAGFTALSPGIRIQAKLSIGETRDAYEHEADAVADMVMRMPEQSFVQRKCAQCEEEEQVQRKPLSENITPFIQSKSEGASPTVSNALNSKISSSRGSGSSMDSQTQSFMSSRFGADLSHVKIHTDGEAVQMSRELNAKAFTVANDIYFNEGQYNPGSKDGKHLLAHELVHTVQQRSSQPTMPLQRRSLPRDRIHDSLLDSYADYSGLPRDHVSQHSEGYEIWLQRVMDLKDELQTLIDGASWKEIRKRVYPIESAPGIKRAGERHAGTLPDLTGLGRLTSLDRFATAIHSIQTQWSALKTPSARLKEVGNAAEVELKAADVPPFLAIDKEPMQSKGYFSGVDWKYVVSEELISKDSLEDHDAGELANVTLHESRHAEQTFLSARFSADVNKKTAPDLATELSIPVKIAKEAVAKKFDASTSADIRKMGSQMHQAMVTNRPANQTTSNDVQDSWVDLKARKEEAIEALMNLRNGGTALAMSDAETARNALSDQIAEVERRYSLYRQIPYEADAHEVGDAAEQAYLGWP